MSTSFHGSAWFKRSNARDGKLLWKYQATPLLYVFDQVTVADGVVYVSGMDGSITALKAK